MDIKNILNDGERRVNPPPPRPHPPYSVREQLPSPALPRHQHSTTVMHSPPASYAYQARGHQQVLPPQQIVYTGPVYQLPPALPPAVEVRHVGNAIHYRYAPYPYEEPPPMDYVYQEYAEIPRQPAPLCEIRYDAGPDPMPRQAPMRPSYRTREHYADRDPLISRVVPVDGGYQYRPSPERSDHQPVDDRRAGQSAYHHARYDSSAPYTASASDAYPPARYRHAHSPYKRPRPERRPRGNPYANYGPRSYQASRSYARDKRGYATSQDSSEIAETTRYTVLKSEYCEENTGEQRSPEEKPRNTDEDVEPRRQSPKQEAQLASTSTTAKTPRKKKRDRPKKSEIEEGGRINTSRRSHDATADLTDNLSVVHAHPSRESRLSPEDWSSEDDMAHQHRRKTAATSDSQVGTGRPKKRRLMPDARALVKHNSSARSRLGTRDDSERQRKGNREPALQNGHRKRRSQLLFSSDEGSLEEEVLDGASACGERIVVDTTSSYESDMGEKADVESGGSSAVVASREGTSREDSSREIVPRPSESIRTKRSKRKRPAAKPRPRSTRKFIPPVLDPDQPYPTASNDFSEIPGTAIGDMLQLWDFVMSFSETLRISPFKLLHLQQAILYQDRSTILDACVVRLVQAIVSDKALVHELDVPDSVVKGVAMKNAKNAVGVILANLPNILSFESDEQDDHLLQTTVAKLENANKLAFYKALEPAGKLRILRELVDYAAMADHLRACVSDSMEHAEEEKKKAREENAANRKKLELQIRELRAELVDYKTKHGLLDNASPADSDKGGAGDGKENEVRSESVSVTTDREETLSRQEKVQAAQKERREQEERRAKERGAAAIIARIEKVKANLKALKNVRLRNRTKEGETHDRPNGTTTPVPLAELYEDPVRSYSLGTDRKKRVYWFFQGSGRIWVENTSSGEWAAFSEMSSVHELLKWLSPYRKEEQLLKKNLKQRLDQIENEITQEKKCIAQAALEEKEAETAAEVAPRTTRAGKRRASQEAKLKSKKNKPVLSFLDYRNQER